MIRYYKNINDGYIYALEIRETTANGDEITAGEYNEILNTIHNKPAAPDGYAYRLTEALEWELYELPPEEQEDEEATDEDYQAALAELGVSV